MTLLPRHHPMRGILWMLAATFCGACGNALARHLDLTFHPAQIVFFSTGGAAILMLPWLLRRGFKKLRTKRHKRYLLRAALELTGWTSAYHALTLLPLPAFTALSFAQPLLMSTAAVMIFREKSTRHTWIAMATGFVGVLLILRPDFSGYLVGSMFVMLTVLCFTSCGLIIKTLTRTESPPVITFYMLSFTCALSLPFALAGWHAPTRETLPYIALIGCAMVGNQYCVSSAISRAPLTTILPFSFSSLIVSSVLAYVFFGELVNIWTIAGGSIILGSAIYALYSTHLASRREERALAQHLVDP